MSQPSPTEHERLTQELGRLMSDISEDCYCAGWLGGTEYFVPELCRRAAATRQPQPWGHGQVTPEQARRLLQTADRLGHWADLDEPGTGYKPFTPSPIPPEIIESLDGDLRRVESKRKRS